jgi:hypothetical protein
MGGDEGLCCEEIKRSLNPRQMLRQELRNIRLGGFPYDVTFISFFIALLTKTLQGEQQGQLLAPPTPDLQK